MDQAADLLGDVLIEPLRFNQLDWHRNVRSQKRCEQPEPSW
jgi:hypothetical protein